MTVISFAIPLLDKQQFYCHCSHLLKFKKILFWFGFFIYFFFVFNSECRGENSVPFSATGSIYNSPRMQFEYRFFFCCQSGNLQVDFFSLCV